MNGQSSILSQRAAGIGGHYSESDERYHGDLAAVINYMPFKTTKLNAQNTSSLTVNMKKNA